MSMKYVGSCIVADDYSRISRCAGGDLGGWRLGGSVLAAERELDAYHVCSLPAAIVTACSIV